MIVFWVVAGALAVVAVGYVLARARQAAEIPFADPTQAVYRRQLAEIDELADRGLIEDRERKSAYAEAARRLLGASDAPSESWTSDTDARRPLLLAVLAASAAALILYVAVGHPGLADQPFSQRLAAWRAADLTSLTPPQLAAVMSRVARERPDDPQAFRYLALAEGAAQDPVAAARALRHAVKLAPQSAELWELLGEAELAAGDGSVTSDAEQAFRQAVKLDPKAAAARFHLARLQIARGDKAGGLAAWRALLAELPPNDMRRQELTAAIGDVDGRPTGAAALPQGQAALVQGMVASLAGKLQANPDDPEGWVRLVRAYAVLGDKAKRDATLATARARYAGDKALLAQLDAAAQAEPMR